jgi:CRP-like cAMP-binding protein
VTEITSKQRAIMEITDEAMKTRIADFFSAYPTRKYQKGKIIALAGQELKGIYYLEKGLIEQYDISGEGNKISVNIFKPATFFPMSWAINGTPNTYFYEAQTDVALRIADPAETVEFVRNNPEVLFDLLSRVYKGTDVLLKRLTLAANGIALNRIVFELLIEAYRFGTKVNEEETLINIQHNLLASRTGLARETVSRNLHKIEAADLIVLTKDGIRIHVSKLEKHLESIL